MLIYFFSSEDLEDSSDIVANDSITAKSWCCGKRNNEASEGESKKKKKGEGFLPYWCLYIAWTLCIAVSFTSALYTLFYSMMWGKEKSNQWFMSMILTFSQDTLINQPAKVLLLSATYAIFIKKSDEGSDADPSNKDPRKGMKCVFMCAMAGSTPRPPARDEVTPSLTYMGTCRWTRYGFWPPCPHLPYIFRRVYPKQGLNLS